MAAMTRVDGMSEKHDCKMLSAQGQREAEQRRQRLAAALRENLRKRKAQERARSGQPAAPAADSKGRASDDGAE